MYMRLYCYDTFALQFARSLMIRIRQKPPAPRLMSNRTKLIFVAAILYTTGMFAQIRIETTNDPNAGTRTIFGKEHSNTFPPPLTLQDCISYALKNQPALNQAVIDEAIANTNKAIALSGWLPQINAGANYQHYFQLPTAFFRNNGVLSPIASGVANYSNPQVNVTQNIFSNDALLAGRASRLSLLAAKENLKVTGVDLVANVSKAFYDVLLSTEKIKVYQEDTARLRKNQEDAYHRYVSGIADKVDYKQATISLNNSLSQLKNATEDLNGKYALLQQLMGSPTDGKFTISFDTAQMMTNIYADTLSPLHMEQRPEYRQMQLTKQITHQTTLYYQMGFLPTLSAFYNYNYQFQSNNNDDLFDKAYPNSFAGLQLTIPIFTGFRRTENAHKARLQEQRIDWDEVNLKLAIYTQYQQALASYKSNLYYLHTQSENVNMAREVYNIIKLQYKEGIKPYLDVIVGETDLQTSEINYLNALFNVLQSKINLEKAMGTIQVNL